MKTCSEESSARRCSWLRVLWRGCVGEGPRHTLHCSPITQISTTQVHLLKEGGRNSSVPKESSSPFLAEHSFNSLLFYFFLAAIRSCHWISDIKQQITLSKSSVVKIKISPRYSPVQDKPDKTIIFDLLGTQGVSLSQLPSFQVSEYSSVYFIVCPYSPVLNMSTSCTGVIKVSEVVLIHCKRATGKKNESQELLRKSINDFMSLSKNMIKTLDVNKVMLFDPQICTLLRSGNIKLFYA